MAFYDWNHNGENDWQDDYIEYQIYQNTVNKNKDSNTNYNSSASGDGCLTAIGVVLLIFGIFLIIGMLQC